LLPTRNKITGGVFTPTQKTKGQKMYELTLRTVPAVIKDANDGINKMVSGWTIKECNGSWLGIAEESIEFTTVTDTAEQAEAIKDYINFIAWQLGEDSIMAKIVKSEWTFTNTLEDFQNIKKV
jgi:hypothetical protein